MAVKDKKRNYAQEKEAHKTAKYRKENAARKRARRKLEKTHGKAALKGKEVDHKNMKPSDNRKSNLRVTSKAANRKRQPATKARGAARRS